MKFNQRLSSVLFSTLAGMLALPHPAGAFQSLGRGNGSLLGGDITDPTDTVELSVDAGQGLPEEQMLPKNMPWVKMSCYPVTGPYAIPHQRHPYQSWVGAPAAAIFMNKPENMKWYVSFKDGGFGGPTREDPYFAAVQLKDAFVLTHFTITPSPDSPARDPREWAIQGSNTGADDDWTDIYACNAKDRGDSPLQDGSRTETFLFTSFTSADMAKGTTPADAKKLEARLAGKTIATADFKRPTQAYSHFRIAIYSCFNPSAGNWIYRSANGFALGQLELFGARAAKPRVAPKAVKREPPARPPVVDAPFIITYWCGPTKEDTTLERYKEIAECGFTVAFAAIDNLWSKPDKEQEEHNRKVLDYCQQAGIKAFIWDGNVCTSPHGWDPPKPEEYPQIKKDLDGMIARSSSHPAFLGFILGDEMGMHAHPRLGLVTQYLLKKDPTHVPYYNLLPSYASGNPRSYERKVQNYLKVVKPALFSWDHYWQMFEGGDEQYYWENLEIVRRNCVKAKVPYVQIIVSIKHMGYRECSEADLRWQVWTSLAYGSRGITYFTYCHVPGMAWGDAAGLLTKDGRRDQKWYYAQKINQRIGKLGPTLVKLTSTGVYCTGPLPNGTVPLLPEAPVKKADGGNMAIGCFKDAAGKVYILPVNRSLHNAITATLTVDPRFTSVSEISQETGKPLAPVSGNTINAPLEAGEGRLFLLNSK